MSLLEAFIHASSHRILSKVDVKGDDECWPWLGSKANGYGHLAIRGKFIQATHAVYCLATGKLPKHQILHSCDNPPCCNPKHLEDGTQKKNLADRGVRGRAPTGDKHWTKHKPEKIARGERHGSRNFPRKRKLSLEQHEFIYLRYANGQLQKDIAKDFGVSKQLVSKILCSYREYETSPGLERL